MWVLFVYVPCWIFSGIRAAFYCSIYLRWERPLVLRHSGSWDEIILQLHPKGRKIWCPVRIYYMPCQKNPYFFVWRAGTIEFDLHMSGAFFVAWVPFPNPEIHVNIWACRDISVHLPVEIQWIFPDPWIPAQINTVEGVQHLIPGDL